jgi:hypothetical protein
MDCVSRNMSLRASFFVVRDCSTRSATATTSPTSKSERPADDWGDADSHAGPIPGTPAWWLSRGGVPWGTGEEIKWDWSSAWIRFRQDAVSGSQTNREEKQLETMMTDEDVNEDGRKRITITSSSRIISRDYRKYREHREKLFAT